MEQVPPLILRARRVVPVSRPPIQQGAVFISGGVIRAIGTEAEIGPVPEAAVHDLGDSILFPGLINAHCHLDYTHMAGSMPPPRDFPDWIKAILAHKANWSYADFAASWLEGAGMLLRHGCTSVVDVESVPELIPDVWGATPLRVVSCLEMTGIRSGTPARSLVDETLATLASFPASDRHTGGLSPHALYSTPDDLLPVVWEEASKRHLLVTMHVAESAAEFELFRNGRGTLHDWLGAQREFRYAGSGSPVQVLARMKALHPGLLAVHVNYLEPGDARLLGEQAVGVVHCPRSHAYFNHGPFPLEALRQAGVSVSIGTDSLATVRTGRRMGVSLDLKAEMRAMRKAFPFLSNREIVEMATLHPARACAAFRQAGRLEPGCHADLVAIPWNESEPDPYRQIIDHSGGVDRVYIGGELVHQFV